MHLRFFLILLLAATGLASESPQTPTSQTAFDFLNPFDKQPWPWLVEAPDDPQAKAEPVPIDLRPFFDEFEADGHVSIYIGYGVGTYYPERTRQILKMLMTLATHFNIPLSNWELNTSEGMISFLNSSRNIQYTIKVGYERNEFINSFSKYEVVMYHGHSRYGYGPAFQNYQNYFRMGRRFETAEVDARNIYFRNEPILRTERYPVQRIQIGSYLYSYQYRGGMRKESKLPETAYTKIIPGKDTDWVNTRFLDGRQLFYFYSCANRKYWRNAIRDLLPDVRRKAVIGTFRNGFGGTKPDALMLLSIVNRTTDSSAVLDLLNTTKDCDECFTTY